MTISAVHLTNCPNCGAALDGAFCAQCGQKARPLNPSLHDVLHDFTHEIFHVDSKIFRSVRLLLLAPGLLSREYFEGRRVRYVSPIRLYLIFSVLYFAVAAVSPTTAFRVTVTRAANDPPQEIERLEQRRQEIVQAASHALNVWVPRTMFLLVPLFAALVALAVRKSGRNYPQHLYFALHVHAAWFFAGALSSAAAIKTIPVVTSSLPGAAKLYVAVYLVLAFRRAYDVTTTGALLRAAVVGTAYLIAVLVALIAILFPLGIFGNRP